MVVITHVTKWQKDERRFTSYCGDEDDKRQYLVQYTGDDDEFQIVCGEYEPTNEAISLMEEYEPMGVTNLTVEDAYQEAGVFRAAITNRKSYPVKYDASNNIFEMNDDGDDFDTECCTDPDVICGCANLAAAPTQVEITLAGVSKCPTRVVPGTNYDLTPAEWNYNFINVFETFELSTNPNIINASDKNGPDLLAWVHWISPVPANTLHIEDCWPLFPAPATTVEICSHFDQAETPSNCTQHSCVCGPYLEFDDVSKVTQHNPPSGTVCSETESLQYYLKNPDMPPPVGPYPGENNPIVTLPAQEWVQNAWVVFHGNDAPCSDPKPFFPYARDHSTSTGLTLPQAGEIYPGTLAVQINMWLKQAGIGEFAGHHALNWPVFEGSVSGFDICNPGETITIPNDFTSGLCYKTSTPLEIEDTETYYFKIGSGYIGSEDYSGFNFAMRIMGYGGTCTVTIL